MGSIACADVYTFRNFLLNCQLPFIKGKSFICTIEVRSLRSGATGAFNTNMEDKHIIVIRVMRQNFCAGFCCKKLHQNLPQNIATSHFVPPCNEFNSNQTITLSTSTNQINAYKIFLYTFKHFCFNEYYWTINLR